jgi:glycosidase
LRRLFVPVLVTIAAASSFRAQRGIAVVAAEGHEQAPTVEKVEPPNWWAGHSINPVRVLIRGKDLTGARVECARVRCAPPKVNAAGTYAFVDVTIPAATPPGSYPIALRTSAGTVRAPFSIAAPLPRAGRFQGFGLDDVVYLIMPDRFANGDTTNDRPAKSPSLIDRGRTRYYHGGDLAGIRRRLPYLDSLGVTALWLNPIYDNNDRLNEREVYDGQPITDYHGYGAVDFYGVDEHFGTMAEVRQLVDEAHRAGIKIIFDMVANHTGPYHPWVSDSPTPTWFNGTQARHLANTWQLWTLADPYSTPEMRRATLDGWFIDILPDLNQNDPEVARYINQNTLWWVGMTGIDGIRQDTWPYVPRSFWREWMTAIKREYPTLRVVGEVFDGDPSLLAFFEGGRRQWDGIDTRVDALFDFPLLFPIRRAFAEGRHLREVAQMLGRDHLYRDPSTLMPFLGNHDVQRFMNERGATTEGLKLAYTFVLTVRGTPLLYYGDEIALPGGPDPDNRRDFPGGWPGERNAFDASGRTPAEQDVWSHVQRLLRLRADRRDLRRAKMEHLYASEQAFVYRRGRTVVALNNDTTSVTVRLPIAMLADDALGICARPRADSGGVAVTIPRRSGCIF